MPHIQVLDQITIDKIAAGEVIERPASIVKELVENAIDAKATSVTVEIKDGGISFIRVTDNGCGIEADEVRCAFLRHSTSKIRTAEELVSIHSLGFRGNKNRSYHKNRGRTKWNKICHRRRKRDCIGRDRSSQRNDFSYSSVIL
mgnify:CR=1 FL=1